MTKIPAKALLSTTFLSNASVALRSRLTYNWNHSFCLSFTLAAASSSTELLALVDIAWIIPARPAPRVRFTSPSGLPSLASAAGAMKMGLVEGSPSNVVEVSHFAISMNTLGRNRTFRNAFVFSACAIK